MEDVLGSIKAAIKNPSIDNNKLAEESLASYIDGMVEDKVRERMAFLTSPCKHL